jgi:FlaA1/EpsC-like NDP-sugar epimerase
MTLLDRDDSLLHGTSMKLLGEGLFSDPMTVLCDIREPDAVRQVFRDRQPEIVLHAAALKHLSLLERHPAEAVKTNVRGTHNLLQAAQEVGSQRFVLISTDKAADPTSVLGASKRAAEVLLPLFAGGDMRLASVRFGNVVGSRGSLLPAAWEQVSRGLPVTVTDPEATRFLMSIGEACSLVLDAASMGRDGETYILDMGEPVAIMDLLVAYLRSCGVHDFEVLITGLRPGEKVHEVVRASAERERSTRNPKITSSPASDRWDAIGSTLLSLYAAADRRDDRATVEALMGLLTDYVPSAATTTALRVT